MESICHAAHAKCKCKRCRQPDPVLKLSLRLHTAWQVEWAGRQFNRTTNYAANRQHLYAFRKRGKRAGAVWALGR